MSINSAMQSGVTALAANSTALATISNNIANSNTTGYKRILTNFTDLVSGSNNKSSYSSGGVVAVNRQTVTNQGELNNNTSGYSLGIDGQGFFVVSDTNQALSSGSSLLFTRDGSFTTDTKGNLVNAGGFYLEGWPADTSGNINTSATDATKLAPINVNALSKTIEATTKIAFVANLDSGTEISTAAFSDATATPPVVATYDATDPTYAMSTYNATTGTGTHPDSTISTTISDSLGQEHNVTVSLLKIGLNSAGQTEWAYEISSPDVYSGDGSSTDLHQIQSGSLFFNDDGSLDVANSTGGLVDPTLNAVAAADATATTGVRWKNDVGAAPLTTLSFGFDQNSTAVNTSTITQVTGDSTTVSVKANGTEFGTLDRVEIGKDGIVKAIYNNGNSRTLAQVALATFLNANGLTPVTGNAYAVSRGSGAYLLKTAGQSGSGTIEADTLEASTVDLAQEFTGLITTQRAYSAASKIVTTADEMLQELLSIKR